MKRMFIALLATGVLASSALAQQPAPASSTAPPGAAGEEAAAESAAEPVDSLQILLAQQKNIREDLADGGIEGLTARENRKLGEAQDEVFALAEGKSTLDELTINEKVRLENALERINALVKNSRAGTDDQQVCWREAKTGSAVKVTRCASKAEMREAREGARDFLERPHTCGIDCDG